MTRLRTLIDQHIGHPASDGAGVRLTRVIGGAGIERFDPFLMLDEFGSDKPGDYIAGFPSHPHRGFETVTIVYQGEVAHRDSTGEGGVIGPGDVQWMTAGAGILHEEFHSPEFTRQGGTLEMVQLWVNLPARDKMTRPGYQAITADTIPAVDLPGGAGQLRVIAGEYDDQWGPAHTHSQMHVWDMRLKQGGTTQLVLPSGWNTMLAVLRGTVLVNGEGVAREAQLVSLDAQGHQVVIEANSDAVVLLLSGQPIDEPIVGHGPFVMNTEQEIAQAIEDFNQGRFGQH